MDAEPHTHRVDVSHSDFYVVRQWIVSYGDTRIRLRSHPHKSFERRLQKTIQKAIRKHDRGSQAGTNPKIARELVASELAGRTNLSLKPDSWGSELD